MPLNEKNIQRTTDQIAVHVMLSRLPEAEKERLLGAMAAQVTAYVHQTLSCPECQSTTTKEDNGLKSSDFDYSLLCPDCGESWSPNAG